jgi:segregation and condensation protein B
MRRPWSGVARARRSPVSEAPLPRADNLSAEPISDASPAAKLARLEAILFVAREPLSTRKLAELAELADGAEARVLVRELGRRLKRRRSAMAPVEVAHGVLLMTRPQLADWMGKLPPCDQDFRLSAPAMETLAVVAYRQPTTRADVEAIRGVQCGEMLRVLMERDLLRIVGRSEELGRPFLYGTTRKFLQVFGLGRLEQLPPVDQIRNAASPPARAA